MDEVKISSTTTTVYSKNPKDDVKFEKKKKACNLCHLSLPRTLSIFGF